MTIRTVAAGVATFLTATSILTPASGQQVQCGGHSLSRIATTAPWTADGAVGFTTRIFNIDADGAPNSYRVDGGGLSYTCDGVLAIRNGKRVTPSSDPKHWESLCNQAWASATATGNYSGVAIFGFEKDAHGHPVVQQPGDPLPGDGYLSTTSVTVPDGPNGTQRHYVDAAAIPYLVLPQRFAAIHGVKGGDVAAVYYRRTDKVAYAIFADTGGQLDEGSVRLHQDLGSNPLVMGGGAMRAKRRIEDGVTVVVFPGHNTIPRVDAERWRQQINAEGAAALQAWGGETRLKSCAER
jgi:Fungal chitosanase of glycosyl hydrolase group 75